MTLKRIKFALILLFFALSALSARPAPAAQDFEGTVRMKLTTEKSTMIIDYFIKGPKARMEMEPEKKDEKAHKIVSILDSGARKMTVLMPQQKKYMVMEWNPLDARNLKGKKPGMEFKKTGKTESILGYRCEQWLGTDEKREIEAWTTPGLGRFAGLGGGPSDSGLGDLEKQMLKEGAFPLRMIDREISGKERTRLEAVSAERKSLAASLFEPPPDFEAIQTPALKGFMKGFKPPK